MRPVILKRLRRGWSSTAFAARQFGQGSAPVLVQVLAAGGRIRLEL